MKKMLVFVLVLVLMLAMAAPVLAYGGGDVGNDTGDGEPPGWAANGLDGEPPGWSQVNPGEGGSDGPAQGPNGP